MVKSILPVLCLLGSMFWSCSGDDEISFDPLALGTWIGQYEIDTIGVEPVTCEDSFLNGEIISLNTDETYSVVSICDDVAISEGTYTFSKGLFLLFTSDRVQEPVDFADFEMQIFDDRDGRITIFLCPPQTGSCGIRKGSRI